MKIDKYSLDDNWEEFQTISDAQIEAYADAVKKRDKFLNEVLDPYLSAIDLEIRSNPSAFDLERATDKSVEAIIKGDEHAIELRNQYIDLDRDVRAAKAAGFAINRTRDALVNLTKLLLNDYYYAEPKIAQKERLKLQDKQLREQTGEQLNTPAARAKIKNPKLKRRSR